MAKVRPLVRYADTGRLEELRLNDSLPGASVSETGPVLTYTNGALTRIDYDSGGHKTFTYASGVLTRLDYVVGSVTTRKTFNYNPDGSLSSIDQAVV